MKVRFLVLSTRNMLEKYFTNTKTKLLCLSEYLQKLFFQVSYWYQECSYGQIMMAPVLTPTSHQKMLLFASQEQETFQHAPLRRRLKNRTTARNTPPHTYNSSTFINSKTIEDFKIRLFNGLYTFWQNKRLRWGLITLLIIAPLSKFFYLLMPIEGFGEYFIEIGALKIPNTIERLDPFSVAEEGWYFINMYYYFFSLGELMAPLFSVFGIFLLFPKHYSPSYLVGVPFGYYLSMLVHRVTVSSEEAFHQGVGTSMMLMFLFLGVVIFMVSDKVLFKQHHRKRASEARIMGLINMPGMTWDDKELIIKKEVADALKTNNELFVKDEF